VSRVKVHLAKALLKYMMKNYRLGSDEKSVNTHLKLALKRSLEKGLLTQSTGKGVTGSVKLGKTATKSAGPAKKPKASAAKKPKATAAAKKPKAATAKAGKTKKAVQQRRSH